MLLENKNYLNRHPLSLVQFEVTRFNSQLFILIPTCSCLDSCNRFLADIFLYAGVFVLSGFSHVWVFTAPWTVACQVPLSMGFPWQEYWSGFPFPPAGDLPNAGTEPRSPTLQADSLPSEPPGKPNIHLSPPFWTSQILPKAAAIFFWIYDFQIIFQAYWNQLNNMYILIYKRNQSAVIFDWLFLEWYLIYEFITHFSTTVKWQMNWKWCHMVNGQKNSLLFKPFSFEVFLESHDHLVLKKIYFCYI